MISNMSFKNICITLGMMFSLALSFAPVLSYAAPSDETNAGKTGITYECVDDKTGAPGNCTWDDLIAATKKIVDWGIEFALFFTVVVLVYIGGEYMYYSDNASKRAAANQHFISVAKGIFFMLAAWLIVTLITSSLLKDDVSQLVPLG
jgi:hypothetical protein